MLKEVKNNVFVANKKNDLDSLELAEVVSKVASTERGAVATVTASAIVGIAYVSKLAFDYIKKMG